MKSLLDQTQTDHEYLQAGHSQADGRTTAEEEVQESQHQDAVEDTESVAEESPKKAWRAQMSRHLTSHAVHLADLIGLVEEEDLG